MAKRHFHPATPPYPGASAEQQAQSQCEAPGCLHDGPFPAPRTRERPRPYRHFCLEHVRAYNAGWDYYRGMTSAEIDADRKLDITWRRPTWAFSGKGSQFSSMDPEFDDPLGAFTEAADVAASPRSRRFPPGGKEAKAVRTMDLDDNFDLASLKLRYKTLVKLWHPDANGGSRDSEDRLKSINEAYKILQDALLLSAKLSARRS